MKILSIALAAGGALFPTIANAQTPPAAPTAEVAPAAQELTGCYVRGDTLKVTLRDPNGGATSEWSVGGSELVAVQFVALCAAAPSSPTPPLVTVGTDKVTKTLNSVAVFRR